MQNKISHISCYYPNKVLSNSDLHAEFPNLKIKELTRLTGVTSRHICNADETSLDMGVAAAENLFKDTLFDRDKIDYVIFCSAGGDYITPASACIAHEKLKLSADCGAFDFNQGCTGYIYGLSMADSLISAGNASNILLITSEAISKSIHPKDSSNRAIFGDAATATLIVKSDNSGAGKFIFGTDGSKYDKIIIKHGRERYPLPENSEQDYTDNYGNILNGANFFMDGSEVFNFSVNTAPVLVNKILETNKLKITDIDFFVFHQANQIILETLGKKLKIPEEKLIIEIMETGNTVSSTIPIALQKAITAGKIKKGNTIMIAGFGVGFSWGGTLIKI